MELVIGARSVLRLLLTLLMLYSHIAAGQGPGSDVGDTLIDDEDANIGKNGVLFTMELLSNTKLNDGCSNENLKDAIKSQIKATLILAIANDCKCEYPGSMIDKDKFECESDLVVQYSGQISGWTSTTYTIKQLSDFIKSWSTIIKVEGTEITKLMFNVTNSQSSVEEFGSGDGMGGPGDNGDFIGSGDIVTIDMIMPGEEEDDESKGPGNVGGLGGVSGELRVQMIGYIITLSTAFAILLSIA